MYKHLKRVRMVIVVDCEYDANVFDDTNQPAKGKSVLDDVASFVEGCITEHRSRHDPAFAYRFLPDLTVFTLEGFRADEKDGLIKDVQPPYVIKGREWPCENGVKEEDETVIPAPCIMCGKEVWHINDPKGRGTAWCGGTLIDGKPVHFLYCNRPECNNLYVWQCGMCSVDVVGDMCHQCKKPRAEVDRDVLDPPEPVVRRRERPQRPARLP